MRSLKKYTGFLVMTVLAVLAAAACGQEEGGGEMSLDNENWESVNLADKENPTVLFHFTGVN
ncbi:hypothetical protein [Salibacterium qingdaonense]|uniref:AhpC/TSA family protein n=1 Tax=Salibacterium qingdaonense TaxID=266892 RepID=A0A1I4IH27_9BACI|nr:hypothetical protein [Salibacterium qingdaonense]SFL53605.1 hypothetical protein SAMN04488054_10245 [Salibacterium qingdaonense]